VKDETCANEPFVSEPAAIPGSKARIEKLVTRYWAEVVVVAIALLVWAPRLTGPLDLRWDGGVYYVLGTSLATGHGYRILSEPGSPEGVEYPPLLPAVVAAAEWLLGTTSPDVVAPWLRKLYVVIFMAYALAALALAKRYLRPGFAVVATILCLLQIMTIFLSDLLFAELPFALVSVVFAFITVDGPLASRPWLRETVSFVLAAAGFLLRTAGVVLFAASVLEALMRRRWRLVLVRVALALLPIIAWQGYVARVQGSYQYAHPTYEYQRAPYQNYNVSYLENILLLDPFRPEKGLVDRRALVTRLVKNLSEMPAALGGAVSTMSGYWGMFVRDIQYYLRGMVVIQRYVIWVPIYGLATLVLGGFAIFMLRRDWVMASIPLLSLALVCLTPWPEEFRRYLMPIAPFLTIAAILAWEQIQAVIRGARVWIRALVSASILGLLILAFTVQIYAAFSAFRVRGAPFVPKEGGRADFRFFYHDDAWRAWEQAASWIGAHAAPSEIVATIAPHQLYLRTGLRSVYPPMEANPQRARRLLEAVPISYVVVDEFRYRDFSRRYARPAVEGDPVSWPLVYSVKGTKVYQHVTSAQ